MAVRRYRSRRRAQLSEQARQPGLADRFLAGEERLHRGELAAAQRPDLSGDGGQWLVVARLPYKRAEDEHAIARLVELERLQAKVGPADVDRAEDLFEGLAAVVDTPVRGR